MRRRDFTKFVKTVTLTVLVLLLIFSVTTLFPSDEGSPSPAALMAPPQLNFSMSFTFIVEPATACQKASALPASGILLVYVHSDPSHFQRRLAIRRTWGSNKSNLPAVVFLLGQRLNADSTRINTSVREQVQREASVYGDIILVNVTDTYRNIALKNLAGLRWIQRHCNLASRSLILKVDDDTFVDTFRLDSRLSDMVKADKLPERSFFCKVHQGARPDRGTDPKAYVSAVEFDEDVYPDHCGGPAYLFTSDLVSPLINAAEQRPYFFIEDVFFTGILRRDVDGNIHRWNRLYRLSPNVPNCYPKRPMFLKLMSLWKDSQTMPFLSINLARTNDVDQPQMPEFIPDYTKYPSDDDIQILIDCFVHDSRYTFLHLVDKAAAMQAVWRSVLKREMHPA